MKQQEKQRRGTAMDKKPSVLNQLLNSTSAAAVNPLSQSVHEPTRVTTSNSYIKQQQKQQFHDRIKQNTSEDIITQKAFEARYKFNTADKDGARTAGYFNSLIKFFVTEKVEIKNENNLPIFLLNKKYPQKPLIRSRDIPYQIEDISNQF